ncbi:hypothetical protein [Alkalicoccus urumqiensis]|uniref:Uncharacterized protein n=1 Tax=Alkalicoccus urumqiensis TaxID=1548213 RepID=A0A2P6MG14_ALKUR|nr:hypothetical protein [Alkalicoccus urumqiensis]PRO65207.1 hypothetical protein C6I21_10395 [Alkalicoccus urumqiensis]
MTFTWRMAGIVSLLFMAAAALLSFGTVTPEMALFRTGAAGVLGAGAGACAGWMLLKGLAGNRQSEDFDVQEENGEELESDSPAEEMKGED